MSKQWETVRFYRIVEVRSFDLGFNGSWSDWTEQNETFEEVCQKYKEMSANPNCWSAFQVAEFLYMENGYCLGCQECRNFSCGREVERL